MDPSPWYPDATSDDVRFTERQERFERLFEQAKRAQFSPDELKTKSESDLIYLAGHVIEPPGVGALPWSKLRMNAERASQELQRRWAAAEAGKSRRSALFNTVLAALVSLVVSFGVAAIDHSLGNSEPTSTSTVRAP